MNHSFGVEGDGKGLRTWYLKKTGSSYHIDLLLRLKNTNRFLEAIQVCFVMIERAPVKFSGLRDNTDVQYFSRRISGKIQRGLG